jgi:acyl-CoA thioesterase II
MKTVEQLLEVMDLTEVSPDNFRGRTQASNYPRVFGGQMVAQALVAACRTVAGKLPHSLNARFLVGADAKLPMEFAVRRMRDGGSFAARHVAVSQNGQANAEISLSFQGEEVAFDHAVAMPDVAPPEKLPTESELRKTAMSHHSDPAPRFYEDERPIELRPVEHDVYFSREPRDSQFNTWLKATARLPDDPIVHRAVLTLMSDMTLQDASLIPHGLTYFDFSRLMTASLDHSVWFHSSFRADEWLLYAQDSPWAGGARGLSRGSFFTRDGRLVASTAQEGLIRRRKTGTK